MTTTMREIMGNENTAAGRSGVVGHERTVTTKLGDQEMCKEVITNEEQMSGNVPTTDGLAGDVDANLTGQCSKRRTMNDDELFELARKGNVADLEKQKLDVEHRRASMLYLAQQSLQWQKDMLALVQPVESVRDRSRRAMPEQIIEAPEPLAGAIPSGKERVKNQTEMQKPAERLAEQLRQQLTFADAEKLGYTDATYTRQVASGDGRQVERTICPQVFPIHATIETLYSTERIYAHWAIVGTMQLKGYPSHIHGVPILFDGVPLIPQPGDILTYAFNDGDGNDVDHCFRVTGWSYENGTKKTIIRLETEPCSSY